MRLCVGSRELLKALHKNFIDKNIQSNKMMPAGFSMLVTQMDQKGVTLIELVVVFVIIGVLALLIVPNIGTWVPNYRLRNATRDIVSTMRTAQMRAISNNIQYRVNFNADEIGGANSYVLQRDSGGGHFVDEGSIQTLPAGITMSINLPNDRAVFNANSTSSSGSVILKSEKKKIQKSITLSASTGRVKIVD